MNQKPRAACVLGRESLPDYLLKQIDIFCGQEQEEKEDEDVNITVLALI